MSDTQNPPAGWTWSHFKSVCADVGSWTWGTVQGAFNEKASLSQIIVDAVIGMIPLVGDATAVRDLIAIIIGMVDVEEKRNSTWQWVLLVVLLFALIPVVGGVIKGVGRLIVKAAEEAAHLAGAARAAHLMENARQIIEFLNRIGVKNAEKWLLALRITDFQAQLLNHFNAIVSTLDRALFIAKGKIKGIVPSLTARIDAIRSGLAKIAEMGKEKIPEAVKQLDQKLREIQAYIRSGGETTSRKAVHELATGEKQVTRTDERRLVENSPPPPRNVRGGFDQNPAAVNDPRVAEHYVPEPGYPDLTATVEDGMMPYVAAYSGKVVNRELEEGELIFRFFGPGGETRGYAVGDASAGGAWWGLGPPPRTAEEWRMKAAVLDHFNRDGFYVVGRVPKKGPKAVVGTVSEQFGSKIPGQYLPGGATQAFFYLDRAFSTKLTDLGKELARNNKSGKLLDPISGIEFELHPTGWTDANGVWGYAGAPGTMSTQASKLTANELATKKNEEIIKNP